MKAIFLDIDGVLNCVETFMKNYEIWRNTGKRPVDLDEEKIKYLSKIVKETNAIIVLSSAWRSGFTKVEEGLIPGESRDSKALFELLLKHDITLYDKTGRNKDANRAEEIKDYLNQHQEIEEYLILDDECLSLNDEMKKHYIETTFNSDKDNGLLESHIDKAIQILNNKNIKVKRK